VLLLLKKLLWEGANVVREKASTTLSPSSTRGSHSLHGFVMTDSTTTRKMRKPDGPSMQPTASQGLKKRSSTTSVQNDDPEGRPSSEGFSQSKTSIPVARSSSGTTSSSSSATANTVVKRKKSRPHVEVDDDESEGAQADAEYGNINGWVNVEGRRRSAHQSAVRRALEADDGRRHSLAV